MNSANQTAYPQHPLSQSFLMHVLPGALVTVAFIMLGSRFDSSAYPPLLGFLLVMLFINIPVLLGIMLRDGKRLTGKYRLDGVVLFRDKLDWKTFILVFLGAFVVLYLLITLAMPVNKYLTESVFSGLPAWMFLEEQTQYDNYAENTLVLTFTLQLVVTGIALPWLEELYFRGFLLPRLSRFGALAPLISGLFFGLYHSWQPFGIAAVFLLGIGLSYVVWWKRDIRLAIALHVLANSIARLVYLVAVLAR